MKTRRILPAICLGLAALVAFPAAQADRDDDDRDNGAELVGTWRFTGNDAVFGQFYDYLVFHEDNTMTEKVASTIESVGSGVWEEIGSDRDVDRRSRRNSNGHSRRDSDDDDSDVASFRAMFETFRDNDADGTYDARTRVRITFRLTGDTLTGTGTIELRTLEDNAPLAGPFEGSTFVATRMELIPQ